jgi:hypothetical protein
LAIQYFFRQSAIGNSIGEETMRNQKAKMSSLLTMLFSVAFVALLVSNATAQRRFDFKAAGVETEAAGIEQFTDALIAFSLKDVETRRSKLADRVKLRRELQDTGTKVKGSSSNARRLFQELIAKLKSGNRWNDDFDKSFLDGIVSPRIKSLIQRNGGARKVLADAEALLNSLNAEIDETIREANNNQALNETNEATFTRASFYGKRGDRCLLLGIGIALAESRLLKMKLTAQNLDNIFDSKGCGGSGTGESSPTT